MQTGRRRTVDGARLRASPEVVSQRLGDAGVLIDMRSGRMYELNATGIRIWELVTTGCTTVQAVTRLQQEFEATPDDVQGEVSALVNELLREGLVDVEPQS